MPRKKVKQLNWGAELRNAFIEFRVFWHGRINRADLIETFGISLQQVSLDLAGYADQWKRNLVYDKSQRAYVRGKNFTPHLITPSAEDYFAQLRAADQGLVSRERAGSACFPAMVRRQRLHAVLRPRPCATCWPQSMYPQPFK